MDNEEGGVKIPLRLYVHKERNQVIFAEANSGFVDTLFSFLTLPMGTIVRILKNQCDLQPGETGCFGNLYESVEKLNASNLLAEGCKIKLLNPRNSAEVRCQLLKLNIDDTGPIKYLVCLNPMCTKPEASLIPASKCSYGGTLCDPNSIIPNMITDKNKGKGGAFVTETASFIVTDNLEVFPNSSTTVFELSKKLGIMIHMQFDEINLNIGHKEMLYLLKCSLHSSSPLTDTFVSKKSNIGFLMKPSLLNLEIGNLSENEMGKLEETTEKTMTIKLFIQKSNNKILFAYADENFVDFLFSLLTIPLGGVAHLLSGNISCGSVGNLYRSLSALKLERHIKSQDLKSMLVDPQVAALHLSKYQILCVSETQVEYYRYSEPYCIGISTNFRILYLATKKVQCNSKERCVQFLLKDPNFKGQYTRPSNF